MTDPESTRQIASRAGQLLHDALEDGQHYIVLVLTTDSQDRTVVTSCSNFPAEMRKTVLANIVDQDRDGTAMPLEQFRPRGLN